MKKTLKIICIALTFMLVSSTISYAISGDPVEAVKRKVTDLSGFKDLPTQAFYIRTIGPFQSVSIKFQQTANKTISATYHSWFGLSPAMKCYSESAKTPCHS